MISNVNSSSSIYNAANIYKQMSSGNKVSSASNNAAGLAIMKKIEAQVRGLEMGSTNAEDMSGLLRTAEGGLSVISDGLQRIRELSVRAGSGAMSDDDKKIIQIEIDQMLDMIQTASDKTQFNNRKLLDGSFADMNTAINPNGNGLTINIQNNSLQALGIDGFNVTGNFDISKIDSAISLVSDGRAKIGAYTNRLDYAAGTNNTASINQQAATSRIRDTDYAKASTALSNENVKQQLRVFSIMMQKQKIQKNNNILDF